MKKNVIKSHLLIGDRFLAALLYFKDNKGRGHLKLSFKNKLANFSKGTDIETTLPVPIPSSEPIGIDISYKFSDSLLEVKRFVNDKFEREFYDVPIPIQTCLFVIKIKNWQTLDIARNQKNPLLLKPPENNKSVAIVFSFLNNDGVPIAPEEYNCLMGVVDIPETPMNKFCIGISSDTNKNKKGFGIMIPRLLKKN